MIFVFEGQGSVFPGMAKEEYNSNEQFRYFFDYVSNRRPERERKG
ncbi:hypothetical protein BREVNS_1529 [Brevinematales bacterium NS]|nr:hypothetical protein BREVNS_1529 [Brevinematales bacterium NS]